MTDNIQQTTEVSTDGTEVSTVIPEVEEVTNQSAESEQIEQLKKELADKDSSLNSIISDKVKQLPESLQVLLPESLSITDKLVWIEKANAVNSNKETVKEEPTTSIGSSARQLFETELTELVDTEPHKPLSTTEKMAGYFAKMFNQ